MDQGRNLDSQSSFWRVHVYSTSEKTEMIQKIHNVVIWRKIWIMAVWGMENCKFIISIFPQVLNFCSFSLGFGDIYIYRVNLVITTFGLWWDIAFGLQSLYDYWVVAISFHRIPIIFIRCNSLPQIFGRWETLVSILSNTYTKA